MEWQVKYEPHTHDAPWSLYKIVNGETSLEAGFDTEEEARFEADKMREKTGSKRPKNPVDKASYESFPASDAPSWTKTTAGECHKGDCEKH